MEDYLEDAVESVSHIFTEESVMNYGRIMLLTLAGAVWTLTLQRQPSDVKHALRAHLTQGFDRSVLASKLQARRTKQCCSEWLQIDGIRDEMRAVTDKAERVRLSNALRRRVLTGLLAGAYLHALTIGLFCIKNTIRVLFFVLHQREEQRRQKKQQGGLLSTWWRVGFKGLMLQRIAGAVDSSSPFAHDQIDEGAGAGAGAFTPSSIGIMPSYPFMMGMERPSPLLEAGSGAAVAAVSPVSPAMQPWVAAGGASSAALLTSLERAFSVKECIEAAIPRVMADAEAVVASVFDEDSELEKKLAPAAALSQEDLQTVFDRLMGHMDRHACISQWIHIAPLPAGEEGKDGKALDHHEDMHNGHTTAGGSPLNTASITLPPATTTTTGVVVEAADEEQDPSSVSAERPDEEEGGEEEGERVQFTQLAELRQQKMATAAAVAAAAEKSFNTATTSDDAGETAISSTTDPEVPTSSDHPAGGVVSTAGVAAGSQPPLPAPPPPPPLPITPEAGGSGNPLDWLLNGGAGATPSDFRHPDMVNAEAAHQLLQTAESFQHVIHTVSFGELVLADSRRVLESVAREAVGAFPDLRKYDAERRTAPVIMVVTKLEELRQRLADETFTVPSYLALFCTELLREEQNRWEIARKEARQMEALLSRKVDSLEKRVMMKEEEVDLTVDGKGHHSGAGGGDSDATFTVVMHSNTSTGMGGASSNSSGGGDIPQTFGTNNGGRSHTTAPRSLRQMEQEFSVAAEELHGLLNTFQNTLSKLFDLTRVLPPTHPNHLVAQRLQSVLEDRRLQLQRAKQDFQRQLHRLQLVPSIRRDMKAFEENAEVRLLLDEQHSLRSTQSRVHRILDQAESTQDMLRQQKERFEHAANGLVHIMERVPIIKRTLGRIDHRRRREVVCLGCVVGFCLFLALICW